MSRIRRLAAAQAHARNRMEERALLQQREQFNEQMQLQHALDRRQKKRDRITGAVTAGVGALLAGGGAAAMAFGGPAGAQFGAPLMGSGVGAMTGGIGQATGSSGVQSMAPMLAQQVGNAGAMYANQQAMQSFGAQPQMPFTAQDQMGARTLNAQMGTGMYQQNLVPPSQYIPRTGTPTPVVGMRPAAYPIG